MLKYFSTEAAPLIANHLWQSTLFTVVAAVLTLALRKNQARVRYGLWLVVSVKFLIPFSLLIGFGSNLANPHGSVGTQSGLYSAVEEVSQPFTQTTSPFLPPVASMASGEHLLSILLEVAALVWLCGFFAVLSLWWIRWRRVAAALRGAVLMEKGREVDMLRELEQIVEVPKSIAFLLSRDSLEPGIFGIVRPVLLWPAGISQHLQDGQLKAIIAHEVRHVLRRDNLTAAIHMAVEATFWFHPLVWWLGVRLVEERERACDEEVLKLGCEPQVYAESILKICEFCVGYPLACASAVTGADLKKRIVRIMTEGVARELDFSRKLLLGAAGLMVVAVPVVFGLVHAEQSHAESQAEYAGTQLPSFEIASVKPDTSDGDRVWFQFTPDGFHATNVPLQLLLREVYGVEDDQIAGAPSWVNSEKYDIDAKVNEADVAKLQKLSIDQRKLMLQPLLADRFELKFHRGTKDLPVYALVIAKNGPKLQESNPDDPNGLKGTQVRLMGRGHIKAQGISMAVFIHEMSRQLDRTVVDKTGLTGNYDFTLQWTPDEGEPAGPSIFAAIQEQLGLKLESQKDRVEMLFIDHLEKPLEN